MGSSMRRSLMAGRGGRRRKRRTRYTICTQAQRVRTASRICTRKFGINSLSGASIMPIQFGGWEITINFLLGLCWFELEARKRKVNKTDQPIYSKNTGNCHEESL